MRMVSALDHEMAEECFADRAILCVELHPSDHLLLWSLREILHARLEGRAARQILSELKGAPGRRALILLRLLSAELIGSTRRSLRFGLPHCQHVLPDELALLAAVDRFQVADEARACLLLQNLCGTDRIDGLAEATDHLAKSLVSSGIAIRVMHLVPGEMLPSVH